jgi:uncharacterized Tic20 family protein
MSENPNARLSKQPALDPSEEHARLSQEYEQRYGKDGENRLPTLEELLRDEPLPPPPVKPAAPPRPIDPLPPLPPLPPAPPLSPSHSQPMPEDESPVVSPSPRKARKPAPWSEFMDFDAFEGKHDWDDDDDDLSDYEEQSYPEKRKRGKQKSKVGHRVANSPEERRWATYAHASVLLTLVAALMSFGFLSLLTIFIPLGIYLHWRHKSEYVAYQALQAFALQVLGTVGWIALILVATLAFTILTVGLALTVIGLVLLIVTIPAYLLVLLASLGMPFAMVIFSIIAATQTNEGKDYRLPKIGRWVDRQMRKRLS